MTYTENASILSHMNAKLVLDIVLEISCNTRHYFRISAAVQLFVTTVTVIGICGSKYHNDNE